MANIRTDWIDYGNDARAVNAAWLNNIGGTVNGHTSDIGDLNLRLTEVEDINGSLATEITANEDRYQNVDGKVNALTTRVDTLEQNGGGGGGGTGVSDHGALTGLDGDDHPQYHTDARGDARYQPLGNYASAAQGTKADNAVQPDALANVATSGSYDDLADKPTIPTQRVPDPNGQADDRVLVVSSNALVYGDAPSGGGGGALTGTGFPEGVVTAPPGATYFDTAQTMGAALWRKYTGTGNTGWRVEQGDTGWRDVTSTLTTAGLTGRLRIKRTVGLLWVSVDELIVPPDSGSVTLIMDSQFYPDVDDQSYPGAFYDLNTGSPTARVDTALLRLGEKGSFQRLRDIKSLPCTKAWPTSLPGTPA